jgi:UDP-N-acetylbacillosamine N-acetyltransferase
LSQPRLVIWGASGHAHVVADIIETKGDYAIVGYLDDRGAHAPDAVRGVPVLGGREQLVGLHDRGVAAVLVGFGDCRGRLAAADLIREHDLQLASAIHPSAIVAADARVGVGVTIAAGAIVGPGCVIGDNALINTAASVDHDSSVEEAAHVGPGSRLGGWVTIGRAAWIGIGATVLDRVAVGAHAVVGAAALVLRDVPPDVLVYGVPARVIRQVIRPD